MMDVLVVVVCASGGGRGGVGDAAADDVGITVKY
jgi:hypothetical protein